MDWFKISGQYLPDLNGKDAAVSPSNVPMTEDNFHLFFETHKSLAGCFYRLNKINEVIKSTEPVLLEAAKMSLWPPLTSCPIQLDDRSTPILFEIESLVHLLSGHAERLGKLLEVHYGKTCKGPLYITISKLPDFCIIKNMLLENVATLEYLHELKNFSQHKMSLSYALRVTIYQAKLLITLPDLICIKKSTAINIPSHFTYNEDRTIETEVTKWMESIAKATKLIVSIYFNLCIEKHNDEKVIK
jgi:hypothetical protein